MIKVTLKGYCSYCCSYGTCDCTEDEVALRTANSRIEELEAKLAKAVKLIELAVELGRWELNPSFRDEMIDFTTGIKGESQDGMV